MACEKMAIAYRIRDTSAELDGSNGLLRRHVGFDKFMRAFLLSPRRRMLSIRGRLLVKSLFHASMNSHAFRCSESPESRRFTSYFAGRLKSLTPLSSAEPACARHDDVG